MGDEHSASENEEGLVGMKPTPRFCPQCGFPLTTSECDGRIRPVCASCGYIVYINPVPSVAAILEREGRLLLVKRNIEPGLGLWGLPGGFVETGETAVDAVVREVREETGLTCGDVRLVDVATYLGGYYGDVLVVCYAAKVFSGMIASGGDAGEAAFFSMNMLPSLAFDTHAGFIRRYATHSDWFCET